MFFVVENNLFCRKCGIYSEKKGKYKCVVYSIIMIKGLEM